ncbi:MAG: sodium:solute symporter family protein [Cyclobacteriaceae bacterium]
MLLLFVLLYMLITVAIGIAASRLVKTSGDFILAGRKLPFTLSAFALFALWFGSETIFGASSEFIQYGFLGVIEDPFGGALCLVLYAIFFVKPIYKLNLLTLGDLFRDTFGKRVELIAAFFMILTFFGYIAAQLVALGILLHIITDIAMPVCIVISAAVVCLYTIAGGMWAISITDFLQSIVIIAGLVYVAFKLSGKAGGFQQILASAPDGFFRFIPSENSAFSWVEYFAAWMVIGLGSIPSQDIFQRANSARSLHVAVNSTYFGAFMYLFFAIFPLFIALAAKVLFPELMQADAQQILPRVILQHTALPVQILFFGALISAIFSTCSGAILAPSSIISENLLRPLLKKEWSEYRFLLVLRGSVLFMTIFSTWLALSRSNIYDLVAESSILGMVSLLVPMVVAIYFKKYSSANAATASMMSGLFTWFVFEFLWLIEFPSFLPALMVAVLAYIFSYLLSKSDKN